MGKYIRKQTTNIIFPFEVTITKDISVEHFRQEETIWCKSSKIKGRFTITDTFYDEKSPSNKSYVLDLKLLKNMKQNISNAWPGLLNQIAIFKFEDQADAANFKLFWI